MRKYLRVCSSGYASSPSRFLVRFRSLWPALSSVLDHEYLFWTLVGLLLVLTLSSPERVPQYPALVDWPTIAALLGLLIVTKGIEVSGALHALAHRVLTHLQSQRALAFFLVGSAALLATVLTNDIALFVIVPLTIALQRLTDVPIPQLVIFETLAVNVGSALTPIGNPQNLFLWQLSHTSFLHFLTGMAPLVSVLASLLLLWMVVVFHPTPITVRSPDTPPPVNKRLLLLSLALYGPFVVSIEWHQPLLGAAIVLLCYLLSFPAVVRQIDWVLLLVFILMFLDLRLVANLAIIQTGMRHIGLTDPTRLFLVGVVASQLISNVPAAILLAHYSPDWLVIAYAVTVGGFGLVVGSLANLIALRLAQDPRLWLRFHGYSVPFLLLSGTLVYGWLRWREATALF